MKRFFHDIFVVARYELADAVRSRRVAAFLVLYLAGAMLICNGFISVLHTLEDQIAQTLVLPKSASVGAATDALWKSRQFREMITHLVGDRQVALELLSIPPIALIYGWMAFTFTPLLVMLAASGRISEEISSGSARFTLVRTTRSAWCVGKFFGQAMEVILALTLSAVGAWCIARFRLAGADHAQTIQAMIIYAWKVWLYSLPFVGLALGISQTTRSPHLAMTVGFIAWVVVSVLFLIARHYVGDGVRQIWQLVLFIIPRGHQMDLWRLDPAHLFHGAVWLVTLSFSYLFAGHALFSRKDL